MNKLKRKLIRGTLVAGIILFIAACTKETNTPGMATFSVYLTDAPDSVFTSVNINFLGAEIKESNGDSEMLSPQTQLYNVLNLTNGRNLLIGTGPVAVGDSVVSVRLLFGTNNSVTVGSNIYPLTLASGINGLIPVNAKLAANDNISVLADLDVPQSITQTGTSLR